ncbi:histone-lysine N-methyltransferase NSD2 [Dermacentor andersoni]|uniref:histone-lysine N-methyltransferase NSD2 n=1 Tax=Dermacentor andersoni TaxID=34620 RepID=UPI002415BBD8|nr:histone-lysine N-methyltransferase NSD2-like [Dermacentor andersoni]
MKQKVKSDSDVVEIEAQNGHSLRTCNGSESTSNDSDSSEKDARSDCSKSSGVSPTEESVRRSRFGRVRKPNVSPCMEYTPIVRRYSSHNREKRTQSRSPPSPSHGREIQSAASEKFKPTESLQYLVGDLLWSKIGQHPFWPAMVSFDPVSGIYTKVIRNKCRIYHVQYFGVAAQHGWTLPSRVLPFEGLDKFVALGDLERAPYAVPTRKRDAWMVAVEEAVTAMQMTRTQRKLELTFEYYDPPTKKPRTVQPPKENGIVEKAKEELCLICEATGATLTCTGPCKRSFHLDCLGITQPPVAFLCDECTTGTHSCLVCKGTDATQKCSMERCGTFYHMSCLKTVPIPLKADSLVCPRHFCLPCSQQKPRAISSKGRLLRCAHCPSTFHSGCLPAGSSILGSSVVVCPRHRPQTTSSAINVNWCMLCSKGGQLLCCEGCPAAFHETCLGLQAVPEEAFLCPDCLNWKHPKYGDILWVKLGCYRWWPAQVLPPADVPTNIQALKHEAVGDFAVRFYGSHDYYWTNRQRVFLFEEGDSGSLTASSKSVARLFEAALEEATLAWEQQRKAREQCEKPAPFRMIRTNRVVCPVAAMPSVAVRMKSICLCTPQDPCRANCLNRLLLYECSRDLCPAGTDCENQRFQKRTYARTSLVRTPGRGWGLQTSQALAAGDFVMEYVGELINEEECERRLAELHMENNQNFYFLTLEKDRIIDAGPKGNLSRFINHSCEPNCETQKWTVNGDTRVGIFAIRDIAAGTELTFNYNLECRGNERIPCACGSRNCSGYIGLRPKRPMEYECKPKHRKGGPSREKV